MVSNYEASGMEAVEKATQWTDIPALDPTTKAKNAKNGGSEQVVRDATMSEQDSRTLVENAAVCHHVLVEVLTTGRFDESPRVQFLHSMCWQALRDLKESIFLAMSGRYSGASTIQRGVIEIVASAIDIADKIESKDEEGWEHLSRWLEGDKGASPSGNHLADILSSVAPDISEIIHTAFEGNREERNLHVHTPVGGQVYDVIMSETTLIKPWMSLFDKQKLKGWYVGYITDVFILLRVLLELFDYNGITQSVEYIIDLYDEMGEYKATGVVSSRTVDISPQ